MPRTAAARKPVWHDRFTRPDAEQLLGGIPAPLRTLTDTIRSKLLDHAEVSESVDWCGLPWRWALVYRDSTGETPMAYLIPNPEVPSVVFRVTQEQCETLPPKKLSRHIREGLSPTTMVAGVGWPEWPLQTESHAKDLTGFLKTLRNLSAAPT